MRYLRLSLIVLLVACTGPQSMLIGCRAYDASLRSLAGYRAAGRLDVGQVATVDRWRPILNSACSGEEVSGDVLDQFEMGLFELIAIEETVQ